MVVQRLADVGVVGDGSNQCHATGIHRSHATHDQGGRVHQQAGGNTLGQAVALELAGRMGNLHQLACACGVQPGLAADDLCFQLRSGVVKLKGGKALFG
jgi:hypothetical protein